MRRTNIRCGCGGEFVADTVTVEAGGESITEEWGPLRCDHCGSYGDELEMVPAERKRQGGQNRDQS